jgi:hypothetical protein
VVDKEQLTKWHQERTLLFINWEDIVTFGGWRRAEKADPPAYYSPSPCQTVGWLSYVNDTHLCVSGTMSNGEHQDSLEYNNHTTLPFGCILDIRPVT